MANRNSIKKKGPSYKQIFDTCTNYQKKAVFLLAGCIEESKEEVYVEKLVEAHKDDNFLTIGDILGSLTKEQAQAIDYILKAVAREHNKELKEDNAVDHTEEENNERNES